MESKQRNTFNPDLINPLAERPSNYLLVVLKDTSPNLRPNYTPIKMLLCSSIGDIRNHVYAYRMDLDELYEFNFFGWDGTQTFELSQEQKTDIREAIAS